MIPVDAVILRTWLFKKSATNMLFEESIVSPSGADSVADVACPLSPEKPAVPVPAIVEITLMECGLNEG